MLVVGLTGPLGGHTQVATPSGRAMLGPARPGAISARLRRLIACTEFPRYEFDVALDAAQSTLGGTADLTYPNLTGETLIELPLAALSECRLLRRRRNHHRLHRDRRPAIAPRFDDSGTVLFLDLPAPLAPGETLAATIDFTTVVPTQLGRQLRHSQSRCGRRAIRARRLVSGGCRSGRNRLASRTSHEPGRSDLFGDRALRRASCKSRMATTSLPPARDGFAANGRFQIESGPVREFAMVVAKRLDLDLHQGG